MKKVSKCFQRCINSMKFFKGNFCPVQIDAGEKDELQKEAEEMNELGIRKLPRDDDGPDIEKVLIL